LLLGDGSGSGGSWGGCSGFGESDGIVDVSTVIDSEDV